MSVSLAEEALFRVGSARAGPVVGRDGSGGSRRKKEMPGSLRCLHLVIRPRCARAFPAGAPPRAHGSLPGPGRPGGAAEASMWFSPHLGDVAA